MKERIAQMTNLGNPRAAWVSTFHAFGSRVLRAHIETLGFTKDFTIFDTSDQTAIVKSILREYKYDASSSNARKIARQISWIKSDLSALENLDDQPLSHITKEVFGIYQKRLKDNNGLDFSDLLLKTLELVRKDETVRTALQNQFKLIFVDEYQDTNLIQYELLKLLSKDKTNVIAVGDEDQSIYSWRGANIFNILNFEKDFAGTEVIKLEQNYRSSKNIIGAASEVIANNTQRKGKTLFTDNPDGSLISVIETQSEYEEADKTSLRIEKALAESDLSPSDIAIFYRTNAQSRNFEEHLRKRGIPYKIIGGLKFYDRREIKDILAYMRLVVNPRDDVSFRRVINVPTRGIGKTTLEKIEGYSARHGLSLVEGAIHMCTESQLSARPKSKVQIFLDIVTQLRESCLENDLYTFYQDVLKISTYLKTQEKDGSMEAQGRIENLEEFGNAIVRYCEQFPEETHITQFLQHMALVSAESQSDDGENFVTMMTLHVAKGLEFPLVFVTGMEEGLFPHSNSTDSSDTDNLELEEERRLFYVGMTRAKNDLVLSYANQRKVWGQNQYQSPSRFLKEIPEKYIFEPPKKKRPRFIDRHQGGDFDDMSSDPFPDYDASDPTPASGLQKGKRVHHPHFGPGVIHKIEGEGSKEKVSVLFDDKTLRKFLTQYANLDSH